MHVAPSYIFFNFWKYGGSCSGESFEQLSVFEFLAILLFCAPYSNNTTTQEVLAWGKEKEEWSGKQSGEAKSEKPKDGEQK